MASSFHAICSGGPPVVLLEYLAARSLWLVSCMSEETRDLTSGLVLHESLHRFLILSNYVSTGGEGAFAGSV